MSSAASPGRDDFPKPVIDFVAREVGFRCSNPRCGGPTIGPGDPGKISNVGVAAHITAASPGGPRYDSSMTPAQRKSRENAVHLCQTCGKLVDDARSTHTRAELRQWKDDAVQLARRALRMRDIDPDGRLKLARKARHDAAVKILEAALMARLCILNGVFRSDKIPLKHKNEDEFKVARRSTKDWLETYGAACDALDVALRNLDVHWGRPPMASQLYRLAKWLEGWHHAFLAKHVPSVDLSGDAEEAFNPPWSWDAVYAGDQRTREQMRADLERLVGQIEDWAKPFLASRDLPK